MISRARIRVIEKFLRASLPPIGCPAPLSLRAWVLLTDGGVRFSSTSGTLAKLSCDARGGYRPFPFACDCIASHLSAPAILQDPPLNRNFYSAFNQKCPSSLQWQSLRSTVLHPGKSQPDTTSTPLTSQTSPYLTLKLDQTQPKLRLSGIPTFISSRIPSIF